MKLSVSSTPKVALAAAFALAVLSLGQLGEPARGQAAAAAGNKCGAVPKTLAPAPKGAKSYTMILRVNQPENVTEYAKKVRKQLRDQDIFLVNTRFINDFSKLFHTSRYSRELNKPSPGRVSNRLSYRCLSCARWAPEQY
jgi:hypothetical protein